MVLKYQRCLVRIKKKYVIVIVVTGILIYLILTLSAASPPEDETNINKVPIYNEVRINSDIINQDMYKSGEYKTMLLKEKVQRLELKFNKTRSIITNSKPMLKPNYNVHIFYYAWYKNLEVDGEYRHWNHQYLDNWKKEDTKIYPTGVHKPPNDIGANYYPLLGCYSSTDPKIIDTHLSYLRESGIGVLVISWTPPNFTDTPNEMLSTLFDTAIKYDIKISLHVEPYKGRNPINMIEYLKKFLEQFGSHPALYRIKKPLTQKLVPVFYIYDSYLIPASTWREILGNQGDSSIRGTDLDAIYLGLLVELQHKQHIKKSGFDGFYTYFATNSFTYGSTWKNWGTLAKYAAQNGLIFIPSVGPGYIDTRVRAWNSANARSRIHGQYYDVAWRSAINNNVNYVSITSFNEWHEGTQIEPAIPKSVPGFTYLDYSPEGPYYYLNLTRSWIEQFEKDRN